jgi:hypothetical protein
MASEKQIEANSRRNRCRARSRIYRTLRSSAFGYVEVGQSKLLFELGSHLEVA